jgi:hypothetical protein
MKNAAITFAAAVALLGVSAAPAAADGVSHSTTCDSLTITAPADTRVEFGVDDEPPGEVSNGATTTVTLGMPVAIHTYVLFVLVDGVQTDIIEGSVAACVAADPPRTAPQIIDPIVAPVAVDAATLVQEAPVDTWAGVAQCVWPW